MSTTVADLDLRSIRVLLAVLEHSHVGRAAQMLGVQQASVSYHLGRLRAVFDDALFVRAPRGVRPTERALELERPARALLEDAAALARRDAFDPAELERELTIASLDYERVVLLADVVATVSREAPRCRIALVSRTARDLERLEQSTLDLVLGPRPKGAVEALRLRSLYRDRATCVMRRDHPLATQRKISLAGWTRYPHVSVIVEGTASNDVDAWLARRGRRRHVMARVSGFEAACAIVERTDALAMLPASLSAVAGRYGLQVRRPPIEPSSFGVYMWWNELASSNRAHAWLRERVAACARALR